MSKRHLLIFTLLISSLFLTGCGVSSTPSASSKTSQTSTLPFASNGNIPTSTFINLLSKNLGIKLTQKDQFNGVQFPDVSQSVTYWSIPNLSVLIYSNEEAQKADEGNLDTDRGSRSWMACSNIAVIYPGNYESAVNSAFQPWCDYSTPTPTPSLSSKSYNRALYFEGHFQLTLTNFPDYSKPTGQPVSADEQTQLEQSSCEELWGGDNLVIDIGVGRSAQRSAPVSIEATGGHVGWQTDANGHAVILVDATCALTAGPVEMLPSNDYSILFVKSNQFVPVAGCTWTSQQLSNVGNKIIISGSIDGDHFGGDYSQFTWNLPFMSNFGSVYCKS